MGESRKVGRSLREQRSVEIAACRTNDGARDGDAQRAERFEDKCIDIRDGEGREGVA